MRIYHRYADRRDGWGRTCWASTKPTQGHDKGWGRLIHDLSHIIHEYRHPKERPHGPLHSGIEREVQQYVEAHGWLAPQPESVKPTLTERRADRLASIEQRIARWERKHKRATRALAKLTRQRRAIERAAQAVAGR
jgi:hypothetical protein